MAEVGRHRARLGRRRTLRRWQLGVAGAAVLLAGAGAPGTGAYFSDRQDIGTFEFRASAPGLVGPLGTPRPTAWSARQQWQDGSAGWDPAAPGDPTGGSVGQPGSDPGGQDPGDQAPGDDGSGGQNPAPPPGGGSGAPEDPPASGSEPPVRAGVGVGVSTGTGTGSDTGVGTGVSVGVGAGVDTGTGISAGASGIVTAGPGD